MKAMATKLVSTLVPALIFAGIAVVILAYINHDLSFAQTEWIKHTGNPVLNLGSPGSWDDFNVSVPSVIKDGDIYKMWYEGFDGSNRYIGYATSPDSINWTKYSGNPVLSLGPPGSWDDWYVTFPSVIKDGNTYKMWYVGFRYSTALYAVGYATSSDGINWTKYSGNPILYSGPDSWENALNKYGQLKPSVIKDGSTYEMWYQGSDGLNVRIGYATSSDGINWTKYSGNPVLNLGPAGSWDNAGVGTPNVIKEDGVYKMWYYGRDGSNDRIGYATSVDGINWTKYSGNPVLNIGSPGSWDDVQVSNPTVIKDGDTYKMWFGAYDSSNWRIGYATSLSAPTGGAPPDDTMHPTGAVHAHDNMLWPPDNKMVTVVLNGYVLDELSIARDGGGIGISSAYLMVDSTKIILRDEVTDLLGKDGSFNITIEVKAVKGAVYNVKLYAADTEPADAGGPNSDLVDSTYIRVPHDMSSGKSGK